MNFCLFPLLVLLMDLTDWLRHTCIWKVNLFHIIYPLKHQSYPGIASQEAHYSDPHIVCLLSWYWKSRITETLKRSNSDPSSDPSVPWRKAEAGNFLNNAFLKDNWYGFYYPLQRYSCMLKGKVKPNILKSKW